MAFKQGLYTCKNPSKYMGDLSKIFYRSSWEQKFMLYCDYNPSVIGWSSEEIVIPYFFTLDGKMHRYFPDFHICVEDKNKKISNFIIEIKPKKDTIVKSHKNQAKLIENVVVVEKNRAKWEAAEKFCEEKGWKFMVLTEDELF